MEKKKLNLLAIIGFIFSLIDILIGFILCRISLHQIKKKNESGAWFAKTGIIIILIKIPLLILIGTLLVMFNQGKFNNLIQNDYCKTAECSCNSSSKVCECTKTNKDNTEETIYCPNN